MTDPGSPIIDFYPVNFGLDLNGKKQDWEAVVKIPFIDEKRLLAALNARENLLSADEKARNSRGNVISFVRDERLAFDYPSQLPGIFPGIICLIDNHLTG